MTADRLREYLERMQVAASRAVAFLDGMSEQQFIDDDRTQMAVGMTLVLIGEAAAKITALHSIFPEEHPQIPWSKIRGMRNVVVHDYYEVELSVIWKTVRDELPTLIVDLDAIRNWHAQGE